MTATTQVKTLLPPADALALACAAVHQPLACAAVHQLVDEYGPVAHVPDQAIDVSWRGHPPKDVVRDNGDSYHLNARWHVFSQVQVSTTRVVF